MAAVSLFLPELKPSPQLICGLCKELIKDTVIIPCCGESYCYDCIQDHLCENEFTCPACKKENVSPDNLAPNKALRIVRRGKGGREKESLFFSLCSLPRTFR